jgi:antitoxin HigA-1
MDENVPHPGRILLDEVMTPLGVSRNQLARDIDVPVGRISAIVSGARAITADTALRLARYFGTTPDLWMRLQADYDLARAREQVGAEIAERVRVLQNRAPVSDAPLKPVSEAPPPEAPAAPAPSFAQAAEEPRAAIDADRDEEAELELEPALPLGPAVPSDAGEPVHGGNGAFPGGAYTPWDAPPPQPAESPEPSEPEPDEDVLELSVDMVVPEPAGATEHEEPREQVPPIPEPPGRR